MKTARRHELQENELAGWLEEKLKALKPHTNLIIGGILLFFVAILGFSYLSGMNQGKGAPGWQAYFIAAMDRDIQKLESVGEEFKGEPAAGWAWQSAGDMHLSSGALYLGRDEAKSTLEYREAQTAYENALASAKDDMLRQRAYLGLAQAYSGLDDIDSAIEQYETVIKNWPGSAMATLAQERLDFLKKPSTREFQKWLAEYKPSGAPSPLDAFRNLGGEDPLGGMQPPDTPFVPAQEGDLNVPSAEIEMDSQLNLPSDTDSPDTDSPDANSGTSDTDASGGGLNAPVTTESNDSSADTTSTSGDE